MSGQTMFSLTLPSSAKASDYVESRGSSGLCAFTSLAGLLSVLLTAVIGENLAALTRGDSQTWIYKRINHFHP